MLVISYIIWYDFNLQFFITATATSYATLNLKSYVNGINYLQMTWQLVDIITDSYLVIVTPTPADGLRERRTQLPAITLGLGDNVKYNVTIFPGTDSNNINKKFIIGTLLLIF